jgi:hypothetical protein
MFVSCCGRLLATVVAGAVVLVNNNELGMEGTERGDFFCSFLARVCGDY